VRAALVDLTALCWLYRASPDVPLRPTHTVACSSRPSATPVSRLPVALRSSPTLTRSCKSAHRRLATAVSFLLTHMLVAGTAHSVRSGLCASGLAGARYRSARESSRRGGAGARLGRAVESGSSRRRARTWSALVTGAEQLIAEWTGKDGKGLLPVVVESANHVGFADAGGDAMRVLLGVALPPRS
jgi:hypothetical protein